tara:strand:- start:1051 stop:3483 length:2433 start_codon:yes stop_codon:yes gene_type:complete
MAKRTYTPDEYQSQFVDFYNMGGIDVNVAAAAGEEEKKQERPNVLTPVSARGDGGGGGGNVFSQIPISGKELQQFGSEDYVDYIKNFDTGKKVNLSDDGFQKYLEANVGTTITSITMGPIVGGLAYGAASLARKEHRKNAGAMQAVGGGTGDMFKFNGQTVSRAPGSRVFTGNLGDLSHEDMYRSREIAKGFIPGTMMESAGGTQGQDTRIAGVTGLTGVTSVEGAIMDPFGRGHSGQRDHSGVMMVTAGQAQRMREQEFRDIAAKNNIDISNLKGADFVNAAVAYKMHVDGVMRQGRSFFARTTDMSSADYNAALNRRRDVGADYLRNKYSVSGSTVDTSQPDDFVPSVRDSAFDSGSIGDLGFDDSDGGRYDSDPGGRDDSGREYGTESAFDNVSDTEGLDPDDYASGGRVGMQAGGAAQRPLPEAGFVAGPPENFTERETVADDQNGAVPEGTFVINAAAVEFAGSDDIRKMILDAYSTAREKGLDIGRVDRKLYEGTVDVALSKGEVVVPPDLAKIIGYDRLEKINNRGKKEVSRRQKKAGGGFLDGKKFAEGGEASDYEDKIIRDEVSRKMKILLANYGRQTGGEKVRTENYDPDSIEKEYRQGFARLNKQLEIKGDYSSAMGYDVNAPTTPTLFNLFVLAEELAHSDAQRNPEGLQRENPYPRITPGSVTDENFLGDYNPKHTLFNAESDFLEEMRAKQIAFATVGELLPKGQRTAEYTRDSYKQGFLSYLKADVAIGDTSPEVAAELIKKYNLDDIPDYKHPFGQEDLDKYRSIKEQMFRSARGDEKNLMLYDAENPTARIRY